MSPLDPADYKRMLHVLDDVRGAADMACFGDRLRTALAEHFGWTDATVRLQEVTGATDSRDDGRSRLLVPLADGSGDRLLVIVPRPGTARRRTVLELLGRQLAPLARDAARMPALPFLTPRETQVAELVAEGLGNQQIAVRLGITVSTVKKHVSRVLAKSDCDSRVRFALLWRRLSDSLAD
ncbi:regulatory LuxR family protein [Actinomadura pelletieri DSM 43383]|uniref:Regulatory LuxR family protein n=1 Tax=Actinomadura pelletieri DSM 43383 TaxID=1120940 RepID=A0A495QGP0_9ACTN|nr:helix-turn-helix transcriptional regulator [Actinomadura pelletieri]RKS70988.1 regulatory LuxR family protein [Actinomadura pelletieri DSM 43383]